jgi:hypothetical protein
MPYSASAEIDPIHTHISPGGFPMASWIRFQSADGSIGFGQLEEDFVAEYRGDMFADAQPTGSRRNLDEITVLSPCAPSKVIALWNNFYSMAEKL